jgi:uncharacterized membrane protein
VSGRRNRRVARTQQQQQQPPALTIEQRLEHFSGPLPSPDILERYDQIVPGLADRVVTVFEEQATHRMDLERTVIKGDTRRANAGMVTAAVFGLSLLAASVYLIMNGHEGPGVLALLTTFAGYGGAFLYTNEVRRRERNEKARR